MKAFPFCFLAVSFSFLALTSTLDAADATASKEPLPQFPPKEPADAPATFRVQDGFTMDLIAAEPLVTDPVAMVYDENGLAYVVEMNDYPYTDAKAHQAWKD